jgi:quercetin dioxygenase-like cupin family protein
MKGWNMRRRTVFFLLFVALIHVPNRPAAEQALELRGITPKVKLEEIVSGHLVELNGKFKLRVTEVTFAPGGYLGPHHHAGPGIRFVASGALTFTQGGTGKIYQAGDYFYETGSVVHTAHNNTKSPVRVVFVEVLPAEWSGSSVIPPKAY